MIDFLKKNSINLILTLIFAVTIMLMQFLIDDLLSIWFLITYLAFCSFTYFYSIQSWKTQVLFLQIITAAVGCQSMSEIYFFCNTITYSDIPPHFSVSSLSDLAMMLFLFSAGCSITEQFDKKKIRYVIIASIVPALILVITVLGYIYFRNINELIVCPGMMLVSYSSILQLIQPDGEKNPASSLRAMNIMILLLIAFLSLFYVFTNLKNLFLAGTFKMLEVVCIALLYPTARSGVEKWSS